MTTRLGTRLIGLALLLALVWRELARFAFGLAMLVLLIVLMGCAPAPTPRVAFLPPPCVIEPPPRVPSGDSDRVAALYIERLYAWGRMGWACVGSQHERAGVNSDAQQDRTKENGGAGGL